MRESIRWGDEFELLGVLRVWHAPLLGNTPVAGESTRLMGKVYEGEMSGDRPFCLFVWTTGHEGRDVAGAMEYSDDLYWLGLGKIKHLVRWNIVEAYTSRQKVFPNMAKTRITSQHIEGVQQTLFHVKAPSPAT